MSREIKNTEAVVQLCIVALRNIKPNAVLFAVLLPLCLSCLEPYPPPAETKNLNYLVVDGFIDADNGTATVALMRTVNVSTVEPPPAETAAAVMVEEEQGNIEALHETKPGIYTGSSLSLSFGKRYKLHIKTSTGGVYESDYINLKKTPPIDNINYMMVKDGLDITVNTHDETGNSRFYRWRYTETWEYHSIYASGYKFNSAHQVVERPFSERINVCWRTLPSSVIMVGSTKRLAEDRVDNFPLVHIPTGSIKLSVKYSILLKQEVLTEDAYNYWFNLQRNTESLGGLFDPLPSEIPGNIHSVSDPAEAVIGYFSGGSSVDKRIFINPQDLPLEIRFYHPPRCPMDSIFNKDLPTTSSSTLLIGELYGPMGPSPIGYSTASSECIDCRDLGGVLERPDFWE
jgi:hypothetical protein